MVRVEISGNIEESSDANMIIDSTAIVHGNVTEKDDGTIFTYGMVYGNILED